MARGDTVADGTELPIEILSNRIKEAKGLFLRKAYEGALNRMKAITKDALESVEDITLRNGSDEYNAVRLVEQIIANLTLLKRADLEANAKKELHTATEVLFGYR